MKINNESIDKAKDTFADKMSKLPDKSSLPDTIIEPKEAKRDNIDSTVIDKLSDKTSEVNNEPTTITKGEKVEATAGTDSMEINDTIKETAETESKQASKQLPEETEPKD